MPGAPNYQRGFNRIYLSLSGVWVIGCVVVFLCYNPWQLGNEAQGKDHAERYIQYARCEDEARVLPAQQYDERGKPIEPLLPDRGRRRADAFKKCEAAWEISQQANLNHPWLLDQYKARWWGFLLEILIVGLFVPTALYLIFRMGIFTLSKTARWVSDGFKPN
ncbi:MAG TPA: hypothetical protein VMH80_07965 [Bryobacteraceae bacterium]|nr:hypothetical protein [Bryobacteraceae bacterium]